jgi:hypothetical protein
MGCGCWGADHVVEDGGGSRARIWRGRCRRATAKDAAADHVLTVAAAALV